MIDPQAQFSDRETRQILARAAHRQDAAERVDPGPGPGTELTLAEVQTAARDAGIDPLHVEAAAREVVLRRDAVPARSRAGLPVELGEQRVVPGAVSDGQWERMVAEFRRTFGKSGSTSQFGPVREWISGNEASSMPVTVRLEPVDEGTLLSLHQATKTMSDMVYVVGGTLSGMAALFGVLAVAAANFPAALPILFLGLALLSSAAVWGGYRAWVPRREKEFRAVLDRAELIARGG